MCHPRRSRSPSLTARASASTFKGTEEWFPVSERWFGTVVMVVVLNVIYVPLFGAVLYGVMKIASGLEKPSDPDYGWYVLGNSSLLSEDVMAREDLDETSLSHGLWTPPPGATRAPS